MFPRIKWEWGLKDTVADHLMTFAKDGLRTLVMGIWELEKDDVQTLIARMELIENQGGPMKEEWLEEIYDEYELELDYVGASAIEDKL